MLAGRSWDVSDLPGGLTNVNVRVTTDDGREPALDLVVRCSHGDPALLGIDRGAEHLNTAVAATAGVGAPVVEFRPDLGMLVIGFLGFLISSGLAALEGLLLPWGGGSSEALQ